MTDFLLHKVSRSFAQSFAEFFFDFNCTERDTQRRFAFILGGLCEKLCTLCVKILHIALIFALAIDNVSLNSSCYLTDSVIFA
jgi:hypothetical protein